MKTAILGFAHAHVGVYCDIWRDQPDLGIEVVAAWDHDAKRLAETAEKRKLHTCATVAEALAQPGIRAVGIVAETSRPA